MYDKTFEEDADVVRVQQAGLKSQMIPYGRLLPRARARSGISTGSCTTRSRACLGTPNRRAVFPSLVSKRGSW